MSRNRAPAVPPGESLRQRAQQGFAWSAAQTLASKTLSSFAQIALAWFLDPSDFGLYAIAIALWSLTSILNQSGIRDFLVHKNQRYHLWAPYAAPLSIAIGVVGMLTTWIVGPIASAIYEKPELVGLLLVLGLSAPLTSLEAVALAQRSINLQFRYLAKIELIRSVVTTAALLSLSAAGFGAYALAWPICIGSICVNLLLRYGLQNRLKWKVRWSRSKYLLSSSTHILAATFFQSLAVGGISLSIGYFASEADTGIFFYAQNLSLQISVILALNLSRVLLPTLSKMQLDSQRQQEALLRTSRVVLVTGGWLCVALSITASDLFDLIVPQKWEAAAHILQILAIGVAFRMPGFLSLIMLKAQGKFRRNLAISAVHCFIQLGIVCTAIRVADIQATAWAVTIYAIFFGPFVTWMTTGASKKRAADIAYLYAPPVTAVALTLVASAYLHDTFPSSLPLRILFKIVLSLIVFIAATRLLGPRHWQDLTSIFASIKNNRKGQLR